MSVFKKKWRSKQQHNISKMPDSKCVYMCVVRGYRMFGNLTLSMYTENWQWQLTAIVSVHRSLLVEIFSFAWFCSRACIFFCGDVLHFSFGWLLASPCWWFVVVVIERYACGSYLQVKLQRLFYQHKHQVPFHFVLLFVHTYYIWFLWMEFFLSISDTVFDLLCNVSKLQFMFNSPLL